MKQKMKQCLGALLSIALILGLMPGMSMTAYADDDPPYAQHKNTTTVITFDDKPWYLIDYDANTVTLLAKECVEASAYNSSGTFVDYSSNPTVKVVVDNWYSTNITAGAKAAVSGDGMFLLTTAQAQTIYNENPDVLKCSRATDAAGNYWWLCSQGSGDIHAACVSCESGVVFASGFIVDSTLGVRPALKLNLSSVIFSSESKTFSLRPAGYDVTITAGSNMTKTTDSGATSQTGVTDAITDVVYTANDGYYFPEDYSVTSVNGISVTRNSYTQITVSGTPTADAAITLTAPTAKTKPDTPTTAAAVDCTTAENNDGKLTGVTTAMEYKKSDATDWIDGTGSDITGLVPGTYYVRLKETDTTTASDNQELTIAEYTITSYEVTYKVVNGTWSDDTTTDKTETVQSGSKPASVPTGMKASSSYTGGSWDTNPAETTITEAKTFTYTFTTKQAATVTKAPEAKTLTYNGSAQELVTAGTATGGEMQYALGTETEVTQPYTTSIPTETNAGTYYVWYKVVGDSNHLDSSEACVEVTIGEEGEVTVREDKQNGNFAAGGLDNSASEMESIVLTTEDQAQIAAGKSVDVWLAVTDNNTTVSETDKGLVENKVEEVLGSDFTVGTYLDLTLWKQVEGSDAVAVTEVPNGKVKVTIEVPENMRVAGATYKIIRIHNGVATVIDTAVDETTWKLTFETDAFSTYALIYTENTTVSGGDAVVTEQPAPADWLEPFRVQLHIAGELGSEQTVKFSGGGALPYEFMEYLQNHPQITLVYHVTYEGEEFTVTIPGEYVVAEPEINWYGPLWLKGHFGDGKFRDTKGAIGTYTVEKGDTLTSIAKLCGTTVNALVEKNGIQNKDLIYPRQIIKY